MLELEADEPESGPWRTWPLVGLVDRILAAQAIVPRAGRPVIVAIEGRSSSGKRTLAQHLAEALAGSVIAHTDGIAWEHTRFGWGDQLVDGVLVPLHQQGSARYRPPAWAAHGRHGLLEVP